MKSLHLAFLFFTFLLLTHEYGTCAVAEDCPCPNGVKPCYPMTCSSGICYCCLSATNMEPTAANAESCNLSLDECKATCPCVGCRPHPPPCGSNCHLRPPAPRGPYN